MASEKMHLVVFHHNRLFRECLVRVLSATDGFEVQQRDNGDLEPLEAARFYECDLAVVDLQLPDQLAPRLTMRLRESHPGAKVLILVPFERHEEILIECIAAGAHGCLLEESPVEQLEQAIYDVLRGETFCSSEIVNCMFTQFSKLARESQWRKALHTAVLTPRERDILELIAQRLTNKQIAKQLRVSIYTVKNHVHNLLDKLQVDSRVAAVDHARERRLL